MTEKTDLALLLDYYGDFLTPRQRELMQMSADEDMSLSEIAEVVGVSRQGVRDCLAKASRQLSEMESKLGLLERDGKLRSIAEELLASAAADRGGDIGAVCRKAGEEILTVIR